MQDVESNESANMHMLETSKDLRPHLHQNTIVDRASGGSDDSTQLGHESLLDTQPHFPSEVPETVQAAAEEPVPAEIHQYGPQGRVSAPVSDSTQPISQSFYTTLIRKSKSLSLPEDVDDHVETQKTLEEGDLGHVDIMSSFVTGQAEQEVEQELGSPDMVDFSPTQSQHNLTQYPESERFKTPATAGRKRNYRGELVASPLISRNPLRAGPPTPGNVAGLSQVFAGTQAASSPFSNGLTTGPRSDRPSPHVELQARPASAADSSPLREISVFKRAVTEPATRYVSVQQSQAERYRDVGARSEGSDEDAEADDTFNEEPSYIERRSRRKQREDRLLQTLHRLAAPIFSPRDGIDEDTVDRVTARPRSLNISPDPANEGRTDEMEPVSEAETEQEDDMVVGTQQPSTLISDEDKENHIVDVPRTVTSNRLHNVVNGSISEIEASPSTRQLVQPSQVVTMHSSAFQDVPNSQPGEDRRKNMGEMSRRKRAVSLGGVDEQQLPHTGSIPADEAAIPLLAAITTSSDLGASHADTTESIKLGKPQPDLPSSSSNGITSNTVPETSSDRKHGNQHSTITVDGNATDDTTTDNFDTAHTHARVEDLSSQPISKTPPGKRRRRLMDISAEPSPLKSTPSFNFQEALELDNDHEVQKVFLQSPHSTRFSRLSGMVAETAPKAVAEEILDQHNLEEPHATEGIGTSRRSQTSPLQQPTAQSGTIRSSRNPDKSNRASVWDLADSPKKSVPKANERKKVPRNAKHVSRIEERLHPKPTMQSTPSGSRQAEKAIPTITMEENPAHGADTSEIIAPNRVFACFNGKTRAYYPALCLGLAGADTRKYRIQWEGYDPDEVDAHGVSGLDLRLGDAIKVNLQGFAKVPYVIHGFKDKVERGSTEMSDVRGYKTLLVAPKQRKSLDPGAESVSMVKVPITAIYLDNNMWAQIKNRPFNFQMDEAADVAGVTTPRERAGTPSTPSSRRRIQTLPMQSSCQIKDDGLFSHMAFAVSYDDAHRKNRLVELIQEQGGLILANSFEELLKPELVELHVQFADTGFTALLTEGYSRKEKYMQALALGLPCLSGAWVEACVKREQLVNWQTYLLPAGECTELDGAARSRVLVPSKASGTKLRDMIDQRPKLLNESSVIIVSGRGKAEMRWAKYAFLIRALGATKIITTPDVKSAQSILEADPRYEWLFVDDKEVRSAREVLCEQPASSKRSRSKSTASQRPRSYKIAGPELIVQSLILGQLSDSELA